MIKNYAIVYKVADSDDEIKFYECLGPYQLWVKLCTLEHIFDYYHSIQKNKEDIFFVEYEGYIWDCTDIKKLRLIKQRLIKQLKV